MKLQEYTACAWIRMCGTLATLLRWMWQWEGIWLTASSAETKCRGFISNNIIIFAAQM